MRLLSGLLFVALTGSIALADDAKDAKPAETQPAPAPVAKAPKVPLRVVRVLPETHQALLFDKTKGTHVLADVGKSIDGFTVEDIDDDTVTLTAETGAQIVLAAPDSSWRRHRATDAAGSGADDEAHPARPARRAKDAPAKDAAAPQDPYAAAPMTGPEDPYGEAPVRAVEAPGAPTVAAPIEAGEGGVRTAEAPATSAGTPAPAASAEPPKTATPTEGVRTVEAPKPIDPTADALAAAITAPPGAIVLAKTDVNAALGNFAALAGSIRGSFTPAGAKLDSVAASSLFAKAGLRAGDTIVAVDNHPLRTLDDAADVYARSSAARLVTLQIIRANKPMTLRVSIQ